MVGPAGYPCAEIVGLNCRFLNHDCEMSCSETRESLVDWASCLGVGG